MVVAARVVAVERRAWVSEYSLSFTRHHVFDRTRAICRSRPSPNRHLRRGLLYPRQVRKPVVVCPGFAAVRLLLQVLTRKTL